MSSNRTAASEVQNQAEIAKEKEVPQARSWGCMHVIFWSALIIVAVPIAAGVAVFAYSSVHPRYTATASLLVAATPPYILFPANTQASATRPPDDFHAYREEQQALVKSRFVLLAALRDETLRTQPSIVREEQRSHAIEWLMDNLRVRFVSEHACVMEVSLTTSSAQESAAIVNGVVAAYVREAENSSRAHFRIRSSKLEQLYAQKELEVRNRRQEMAETAKQLGGAAGPNAVFQQQIATGQVLESYRVLVGLKNDLERLRGDLKIQTALAERASTEMLDAEVEALAQSDAITNQVLLPVLAQVKKQLVEQESRAVPDKQAVENLTKSLKTAREQLDARRESLRQMGQQAAAAEVKRLAAQVAVLSQMVEDRKRDHEQLAKEAEQLSTPSVELDMMREELRQLEEVLRAIALEREKLRVELGAAPRIQIISEAEAPQQPD